MTTRSKLVLATLFLVLLGACSASDELNSGAVIPSAHAADGQRALYPPLSADAVADDVRDYH
jgi:hypothetical protein